MSLTPLELPGWVEFNAWRTGLKEHRFSVANGGAEVRAVFYLDGHGRLRLPPNNAYMPVVFRSERERPSGRTAQWLAASAPLVEEMRDRGVVNHLHLPPEVDDVRPWLWRGFLVRVGYTYCLDFPFDVGALDRETRHHCDKAMGLGMTVDRVASIDSVMECLAETEARKGFSHRIGARELRVAQTLLGSDSLRMYVCFDSQGRPAAARAVVHSPGARAVAWMAGTKTTRLADGANYLLWRHSLDDLSSAGATGIDLNGANIESVAMFKSQWGGHLAPTYAVRTYSIRAGYRFLADWRASSRGPGQRRSAPGRGSRAGG